ncbi:MAG: diacylglycerol kinase [Candidatus Komeilibacteria bacterium CG_4_10_14_0_2_um_filter_37_10]|uniref:Dihydrofolate reductase n=1 Tax=Candidatus Komeilibacteria bacterium CG_4_10_14_0_2_um_filter_37_10 TaxID=1974470 RepID=A0A2M7VE12_9BACT|nr:MAG: diacylglycerol kinase [Candidatus Komeilibacteria bacterium CG_4_10_14_0_2_um_filter_37_10]
MNKPRISIICAIAPDRAIGKDNRLLWHLPVDLAHFKRITAGHAVVMGQKTFESIGRPLPNRQNIVLSLDPTFQPVGVKVVNSLANAIEYARSVEGEEIFIIGGGSVYQQTIDLADRLYLTVVDGSYEADTYFPEYSQFTKVISSEKAIDGQYHLNYLILEK